MAFCLMAPRHYLNQCWLVIRKILWHLHESNFTGNEQAVILYYEFENYALEITATSPRSQWVNGLDSISFTMKSMTACMHVYCMVLRYHCVCAQPMRDDVTMWRHLSLAGHIHDMIPGFPMWNGSCCVILLCWLWKSWPIFFIRVSTHLPLGDMAVIFNA